ncbi:MAG: dihydrofolate reductase family protein [Bauldia sp.]
MALIAGMSMSLDGFVSDRDGSVGALYADLSSGDNDNDPRAAEIVARTGAVLMGRRTFEMAKDPDAFADTYEFQVPLIIVSSRPPATRPKENDQLRFIFVTTGLKKAVAAAKAEAGGRDVTVVGGARTIQSLLNLGLVDELHIDVVPVILGDGLRLFENLTADVRLEQTKVDALPGRTGLRYAVRRR